MQDIFTVMKQETIVKVACVLQPYPEELEATE